MEDLKEIMDDLSELQFSMEGLAGIMTLLEEAYSYKHEYEMQKNLMIFKMILNSMSENLSDQLEEIDRFILRSKKEELL